MQITSRKKSLPMNAISNWVALGVTIAVSFLLTPYIITHVGQTNYGIWAILTSIIGMYGLLDLGVTSAVARYGAYYLGERDSEKLNSVYSSSMLVFSLICILCLCVTVLISQPLALYFNIPKNAQLDFKITLKFFGLSVGLTFISSMFVALLRAHERYIPVNMVKVIVELVRGCLSVFLVSRSLSIKGLAIAVLVSSTLGLVSNVALIKFLTPNLKLHARLVQGEVFVKLFSFGIPAAVIMAAGYICSNLDSLVVGKWVSISAIALYVVGAKFSMFLSQFMIAISGVLDPRFARLAGESDQYGLEILHRRSTTYLTSMSVTFGLVIIWVGKALLSAWVGVGFLSAYPVLVLLTASQMLSACMFPSVSLLFALNRHRILSIIVSGEAVLNLLLSIVFAELIGMNGVALGTLIPVVLRISIILYYLHKLGSINMKKMTLAIARPIFVIALFAGILMLVVHPVHLSWSQIILFMVTATIALLLSANYVSFLKEDRINLVGTITRALSRDRVNKESIFQPEKRTGVNEE
jgi:O-antigen/teichoic acid export membrane protein